jgi:REP element-mobilizing transposase RayT
MKYNPQIHHRRSIRLKGYDYAQAGLYFITICCQDRTCLFGEITDGEMILNDAGQMVETQWLALPNRFPNIALHEYVVMPNHFHAILEIVGATLVVVQNTEIVGQQKGQSQGIASIDMPVNKTIGDMMDAFKSITTVEYIRGVKNMGWQPFNGKIWQRNYHEHIIRNEQSYQPISNYIINNSAKWADNKFNTK